jgi:hypothetical protein
MFEFSDVADGDFIFGGDAFVRPVVGDDFGELCNG